MSPYEILGIRPTASLDEAEAAYRALLRECHPDLHLHAGAEATAWAEQRTRALNAAIRAIRTGDRVVVGGRAIRSLATMDFHSDWRAARIGWGAQGVRSSA